jgi:transketolase
MTVEMDKMAALATAASEARCLAMDSITAVMRAAEIGAVLYGSQMTYNPKDPTWINRDRFILSAGRQSSTFVYSWLNMAGYRPMEDIHILTRPGLQLPSLERSLPLWMFAPLVGPFAQGVSNGVGFAASEKMAAAVYNTKEHKIFDHHIYVLTGDGCFEEGESSYVVWFAAKE